jgi:AcrR family transcriptional regulator
MARPRQIDRSSVLDASLAIADDGGLDAVTMQAVADRLGVTPMALYRHVESKSDLLDGVVEKLIEEIASSVTSSARGGGVGQLAIDALGKAMRSTARRHPAVFPLLLQRPANTTESRGMRDGLYALLEMAGVPKDEVPRIERLLTTALMAFAASEASGRFSGSRSAVNEDFDAFASIIREGVTAYLDRSDP